VLGRPRAWVIANTDVLLEADAVTTLDALAKRRAAGEPLAYLTGQREFFGLALAVSPDVLVPRPDTETLVDWALDVLRGPLGNRTAPRVIDLGTGSGAIALAVKHTCPRAEVHATDLSAPALDIARRNGQTLAVDVQWHEGDWWNAVPGQRFDLVLANPPYVAPQDPHLRALLHEPVAALTPERDRGDGMADIERIIAGADAHLTSGAWLLVEHGAEQASAVRGCLHRFGFLPPLTRQDFGGRERVTGAIYAR
jgi:release factor glutamine methyltransferase